MDDKCSTKHCRGDPEIRIKGKWLCDGCWEKYCDGKLMIKDEKDE